MGEPCEVQEATLGALLLRHADELVHRWYERCQHDKAWLELGEKEVKDSLSVQIRVLGDALRQGVERAPPPGTLWLRSDERLQTEERVLQRIPIEQVVRGYGQVTACIFGWLEEIGLRPSMKELTYLSEAMHELVAEAVRRYFAFQSELVRRDRGEYLAGVAHQMRGPLSVLTMGLARIKPLVPPDSAWVPESMERSIRRLVEQSSDVMKLERYSEHDLPVRPERLDVAHMLRDIILDVEAHARDKGLSIQTIVEPGLEIEADPTLLIDALGNVVQNAVKYTDRGGVTIDVASEPGGTVCFQVIDTGPGIDPGRQAELFKPTHPSKPGGVGIGLAVAHRGVRAQGGQIDVRSAAGRGATFWFRLPAVVASRG